MSKQAGQDCHQPVAHKYCFGEGAAQPFTIIAALQMQRWRSAQRHDLVHRFTICQAEQGPSLDQECHVRGCSKPATRANELAQVVGA